MFISLLFDVEDIIDPEADDIAGEVAGILSEEGVRATFCVVGERARQWRERGRGDVVAALAKHDVGFHSDFHSVHPTVIEAISTLGWEEGVEQAIRQDGPGVEAIREVFGVMPSCWGNPGDSWAPQINEAMRRLGVPAMVYQHTRVPHGDIHRFCGVLAYPHGRGVNDGEYHETAKWRANLARVIDGVEADRAAGLAWAEVFMGHPTRILHEEFWDGPNFSLGSNPPKALWVAPKRKSSADLEVALKNLRETARSLKTLPDVQMKTIREMNALAGAGSEEPLTEGEIAEVAPAIDNTVAGMGWIILDPAFDVSRIRAHTAERLSTLRRVILPAAA